MEIIPIKQEEFHAGWRDQAFLVDSENPVGAWSTQNWQSLNLSENNYQLFFVFDDARSILGLALFQCDFVAEQAHLVKIVVQQKWRRQGKGEELLSQTMQRLVELGCKVFTLEVWSGNDAAVRLYQKYGFKTVHLAKNFYGSSRDALKMCYSWSNENRSQ
jgi:ribosomal-protein-alanine N-acetyltransferase